MQRSETIEDFLNTCGELLTRAEDVIDTPHELKTCLKELDDLLILKWSDIVVELNDTKISLDTQNQIKFIFTKLAKLELISESKLSLFDGMKEFMQRSTNR